MEWPLRIKTRSLIAVVAAGWAFAPCKATTPPADQPAASAAPATAAAAATPASQLRDLTPQEKKIVVDAIAPSLREPGSAKYKWTKFPIVPPSDEVSYCGIVDAKSPHAAYDGRQAYIVANMCATHGLDPNSAS